jgi:hypothetical protein
MAAFEPEQPLIGGRPAAARDPHVFAAPTRRRARALQLGALCAAVLALAWIAALAVALLGADALPGAMPAAKASPAARPAPIGAPESTAARSVPDAASGHRSAALRHEIKVAAAPERATARAYVTVASPGAPVVPPAAPTPAAPPAAPRQGWARRGWTAPPGHVKPDRAPPHRGDGGSSAAAKASGTTPGQSGLHARNG